jgi:hypothetical protein
MSANLRLRGDVAGLECVYAVPRGRSTIGCLSGNAVVLPVRGVSRRHAELAFEAGELRVSDLASRNGVRVNGELVRTARLVPGDELQLGPVRLRVEREEPDAPLAATPALAEADPLRLSLAAGGCLVAQLVLGKATRDAFFLTHFDVRLLPTIMAGSSALAILVVLLVSRAQARNGPGGSRAACAASARSACWGFDPGAALAGAAALILYGYAAAFGASLLSSFWAVLSER